jgi:hypothetical protein
MRNVTIELSVLTIYCHVSEKWKYEPEAAHTNADKVATTKAAADPLTRDVH